MKQLVKGIVFAAAALMLMQAPQAQAKVKVKKVTVKSNYGSSVHDTFAHTAPMKIPIASKKIAG